MAKQQKNDALELSRTYTISVTTNAASAAKFEDAIKKIDSFKTVRDFWAVYQHLKRPDDLPPRVDYNLVRQGKKRSLRKELCRCGKTKRIGREEGGCCECRRGTHPSFGRRL
eukprot:TRINITY_DN4385_c0_g1_i3.p3 TRINITY_DN4385_c0_g1~~TRINITY_DN4385_c0_g1_i3.p3  ORF type:complete len:112 (-),score=20.57 TRINITY_DN4385_c0_g1_i3:482-817(-)